MGSGASAGNGRSEAQLLVRAAGRRAQAGIRTSLEPARHSIRPAGDRLRRQDHQHAQALGRRHAGLFRFPAIQSRRIRRCSRRDTRSRIAHASSLPRRFHLHGPGVALPAGIFPRRVLDRRPGAPFPAYQPRLERVAGEGRDSAERHASGHGGAGADARAARRRAFGMGRGLGAHATLARLHQSHAAAGGAREVAARMVRADHSPQPRDHSRDQPAPARHRARALPRRRRSRCAHESHRAKRRRPEDPDGQSRHRRVAQHERRRRHPLGAGAHAPGARFRRNVSRALQQQDQRRYAAPLAVAGQSVACRA